MLNQGTRMITLKVTTAKDTRKERRTTKTDKESLIARTKISKIGTWAQGMINNTSTILNTGREVAELTSSTRWWMHRSLFQEWTTTLITLSMMTTQTISSTACLKLITNCHPSFQVNITTIKGFTQGSRISKACSTQHSRLCLIRPRVDCSFHKMNMFKWKAMVICLSSRCWQATQLHGSQINLLYHIHLMTTIRLMRWATRTRRTLAFKSEHVTSCLTKTISLNRITEWPGWLDDFERGFIKPMSLSQVCFYFSKILVFCTNKSRIMTNEKATERFKNSCQYLANDVLFWLIGI